MNSTTEIKLNDGRTNRCDADFDPVVSGGNWHPSEYAMFDAAALADQLIGGEDAEASELGIEAVTDFVPNPNKWSCFFSGRLVQDGVEIGTFEASTNYQFD